MTKLVPVSADFELVCYVPEDYGGRLQSFFDETPDRVRLKFLYYMRNLEAGHHLKSPEQYRHLHTCKNTGNQVYELKVHLSPGWRLYYVDTGGKFIFTHGIKKPKDKQVPQNYRKALELVANITEGNHDD